MARPAATGRFGRARALARCGRGVTAIEFALLLPLFVTLLFGIIQFGQVLFFQAALQHAVIEAARCSTIYASGTDTTNCSSASLIADYAATQAYGFRVAASAFATSNPTGYHCVGASYPYNFSIPFMTGFQLTLTAKSCYPD
jgi:Flp pilus assembly protein TadG